MSGLLVGILASTIDIVSQWLGTIRTGVCAKWYLNSVFCCWKELEGGCSSWSTWTPFWITNLLVYTVLSLVFAASACLLVLMLSPSAKLSGIPEIRAMIFGSQPSSEFLAPKTLIVKTIGLCLSVGSGLWIGKEAPLVHLAGCCTQLCVQALLETEHKVKGLHKSINEDHDLLIKRVRDIVRDLLPACAAAGISVAFGTPIGGVVYALECVSSSYSNSSRSMWYSFVTAMAAAVSLQTVNPFHSGQLVLFHVAYDRPWHIFEVAIFALIGALGGLFGTALIWVNSRVRAFIKADSLPAFLKDDLAQVAAVSVLTSIVGYPFRYMRIPSSMLITHLFRECSRDYDHPAGLCDGTNKGIIVPILLACCAIGFFLTCLTYGLSVPAGVLMPTMVCGALFGRAVGLVVQSIQLHNAESAFFLKVCPPSDGSGGQCVTPGVYALVGAAAALTGVTRMTVSCVVIVCEFTGALTYIIPIMAGVMISKWVADAFNRRGVDEQWIKTQLEIPLIDNVAQFSAPVPDQPVEDIATLSSDCSVLYSETDIESARAAVDSRFKGFPVIKSPTEPTLIGYVFKSELKRALERDAQVPAHVIIFDPQATGSQLSLDLSQIVDNEPIRTPIRAKLITAVHLFQTLGVPYLLLEDGGRFAGIVTRRDIWNLLESPRDQRKPTRINNNNNNSIEEEPGSEADSLLGDLSS